MALDPDILPIFLQEAAEYLSTLSSASASAEQRRRAAHGLKGAAGLVGLVELSASAARMLELALTGQDQQLQTEVDGARALLAPLARSQQDLPEQDEADEPWDAETAALLMAVFVEEAREHV